MPIRSWHVFMDAARRSSERLHCRLLPAVACFRPAGLQRVIVGDEDHFAGYHGDFAGFDVSVTSNYLRKFQIFRAVDDLIT